jgi:hypothetical protein
VQHNWAIAPLGPDRCYGATFFMYVCEVPELRCKTAPPPPRFAWVGAVLASAYRHVSATATPRYGTQSRLGPGAAQHAWRSGARVPCSLS